MGTPVDFNTLLKEGAIIVDVRTVEEFKSGNITGSKNIPLHILPTRVQELKGKKVVLVCRSGGRASQAQRLLSKHDIESHNAGAWQNLS